MSTGQIPFLDLVTVHRELRDELRAIFDAALDSAGFIGGPMVQAFERDGIPVDIEADGIYSVCIQHNIAPLRAKVFLDRMTDLSTITLLTEFEKYWRKEPTPVI